LSYLGQETGGDADSRVTEAHKIVEMLASVQEEMTSKEASFVESMDNCTTCSGKQLFWLRDIKDKYLREDNSKCQWNLTQWKSNKKSVR